MVFTTTNIQLIKILNHVRNNICDWGRYLIKNERINYDMGDKNNNNIKNLNSINNGSVNGIGNNVQNINNVTNVYNAEKEISDENKEKITELLKLIQDSLGALTFSNDKDKDEFIEQTQIIEREIETGAAKKSVLSKCIGVIKGIAIDTASGTLAAIITQKITEIVL